MTNSSRECRWCPFLLLLLGVLCAGACDEDVFKSGRDASPDNGALDQYVLPDSPLPFKVTPINPKITVEAGKTPPTVQFQAWLQGVKVSADWILEQAEYGKISKGGVFTPSGKVGGVVKVGATVNKLVASTTLTVTLKMSQNGATKANGNPGTGGFGGVGGEGLGPPASTTDVKLLDGTPTAAPKMKLLYPYDKTVWPLGILAPLIQWSAPPTGKGDALLMSLTSTYFEFKGYFARPKALTAAATLNRHPVPQDVWTAATRSAAGEKLTLKVVLVSGGVAHGPMTQSWTIARGRLHGTVYYQSYGTNLAKNYGKFGGATLAIKGGSTNPTLVAGKTGFLNDCRVCHSVSANGTRMVVQHGDDYNRSSSYDLLNNFKETVYPSSTSGKLSWIGMTADGKLGLSNAAPLPGTPPTATTSLYDMTTGAEVTYTGLSSFVTKAAFPMFSPDSKLVAFNFYAGTGDTTIGAGDTNKLVLMVFDVASKTFSKPKLLYKGAKGSRPGWPVFWPTSKALVFQIELPGAAPKDFFGTSRGGKGELRWVDLTSGKVQPLDRLNGKEAGVSYLPTGPYKHDKDYELNYEPTVSPIASGGYAWVVFMSRRLYGNVATINPWESDPRVHDLTKNPTPKKLWVAALDLNPKAGADPSHPAFYLPAQELLAGNTRGFWVADPCKADGKDCKGGDECCGGYCIKDLVTAKMICGKGKLGCAKEADKCTQSSECCNYPKFLCINGYCTRWDLK